MLTTQARASARGRGAQAKLHAARRLEELADRCQRVVTQIQQRSRGEKITDRLVSVRDPDARPIRKGELGKPNEFGYVVQVTANTGRGARGYVLPAASTPGNPGDRRLLGQTVAELDRLGLRPREVALDGGFVPGPTTQTLAGLAPTRTFISGRPSPAPGAPAGAWSATAPAARAASATSNAAMGCGAAASRATRASGSGPAGRSWPTTWTPSPSTPPERIGHHAAAGSAPGPQQPKRLTPARFSGGSN